MLMSLAVTKKWQTLRSPLGVHWLEQRAVALLPLPRRF
jgi:hypothetical protein